jgi:hypothetical protein
MSRTVRGILLGGAAVLAIAFAGSVASRTLGFDYSLVAPISIAVSVAIGVYVGLGGRVSQAAIAGGTVGVIDATLGWAISWAIGPGRPQPGEAITFLGAFNTTLFVALLYAAGAALGAWLIHRRRRRRAARAA